MDSSSQTDANDLLSSDSFVQIFNRLLQQSNDESNDDNLAPDHGQVSAAVAFYGLIIFLFVFSVVCFPYCRRRNNEDNTTQQQNSNNTSRVRPRQPKPARKIDFKALLSETTMQVKSTDLIKKDASLRVTGDFQEMSTIDNSVMYDVELGQGAQSEKRLEDAKSGGHLGDEKSNSRRKSSHRSSSHRKSWMAEDRVLQLPKDGVNGNRVVPSMCAICLSSYRKGESVSWSASPQCSHAYHTSCIVQYAQTEDRRRMEALGDDTDKKLDVSVPCPLCRSPFVHCSHDDVQAQISSV